MLLSPCVIFGMVNGAVRGRSRILRLEKTPLTDLLTEFVTQQWVLKCFQMKLQVITTPLLEHLHCKIKTEHQTIQWLVTIQETA